MISLIKRLFMIERTRFAGLAISGEQRARGLVPGATAVTGRSLAA